ncbi:MAG: dephospho-CoA kinase [Anaerolineae bacterium]
MSARPYVIGLTGRIATGKSTVARMLADLGACVIDADLVAHEIMRAGTAVHTAVVERFSAGILTIDGEIDRQALGARVFADPAELLALDTLVHPAVRRETRRLATACASPIIVVEAIKLLEAGMDADCDAVWVVTAPPAVQVARLMGRSALTCTQAELRIHAQAPQSTLEARADVVIDNGGALDCTRRQVERAWRGTFGLVTTAPQETFG